MNFKDIIIYYSSDNKLYKYDFGYPINAIDCKFLDCTKYLCAVFWEKEMSILILSKDSKQDLIKNDFITMNSNNYNKVILYDTNKDSYKILCIANKENYVASCELIEYSTSNNNGNLNDVLEVGNINTNIRFVKLNCPFGFETNKDNCYIITFMSEFLLCCGIKNQIICQRKNNKFEKINEFKINLLDNIYNLTMENNNNNYVTLTYINENTSETNVYKYYIYPPECNIISKNVTPFNEIEFILFHKKTNTQYYIAFNNLPFRFGKSKLNGIELDNINKDIKIEENETRFIFIYNNNDNSVDHFDITYNISILETYSTECKISLYFKSCYKSCKKCTLNADESNVDNQNCIECNEEKGYYQFLDSEKSYCYTKQEMADIHNDYY